MELYVAFFVVLVVVGVLVHQSILFHVERRRFQVEKADLLNRLMARDFTAYAAGSVAMSPPADRRLLSDYFRGRAKDEEKEGEADGLGMSVV